MQNSEFHSDLVDVLVTEKEGCLIEMVVKASSKLSDSAFKKALASFKKEVSVPGFRKGKAPDSLIKSKFKKGLEDQTQKELADLAFKEAQELAKVPVLNGNSRIQFKKDDKSDDENSMIFTFETEPTIPEIDTSKLKLEVKEQEETNDEKVDQTINQIRQFFAKWNVITEREAKDDDYVTINLDVIEEGDERNAISNSRYEVSKKAMPKWMYELVVGMKTGDNKEGISEVDEEATEEDKKTFTPKKVKLTVTKIEEAELPAVDDTFSKMVGVETVEEMKTNLQRLLKKQAAESVQFAYRDQICDLLIENTPFELPKSIIDKEIQVRLTNLIKDPDYHAKLTSMNEDEQKKEVEKIKQDATKAIALFYICRKVVQDEKIDVSPEELTPEVKSPLDAMFSSEQDSFNTEEKTQEQQAMALSRLMLNKAQDHLIEKALQK